MALETAISPHRGSVGEPGRGLVYRFWGTFRFPPFLGSLREGKVFFSETNFFEEFEKYVKKTL